MHQHRKFFLLFNLNHHTCLFNIFSLFLLNIFIIHIYLISSHIHCYWNNLQVKVLGICCLSETKFLVPDPGYSRAGRYDNPKPESTISQSRTKNLASETPLHLLRQLGDKSFYNDSTCSSLHITSMLWD
jgi:hypothetical protein